MRLFFVKVMFVRARSFLALLTFVTLFFLWPRRRVSIFMDGGLGDFIALTPYLRLFSRFRSIELHIYTKDTVRDTASYSYGKTRLFSDESGGFVDPRLEWSEMFLPGVPIIATDKFSPLRHLLVHHRWFVPFLPTLSRFKVSTYFGTRFLHIERALPEALGTKYSDFQEKIKKTKSSGNKVVALHLRRNSSAILEMAVNLQRRIPNLTFIILGSTEHQEVPSFTNLNCHLSLVDSYTLGITTVGLLRLLRDADFFIGGRGGLEIFALFNDIPSCLIFDDSLELFWGHWDRNWWSESQFLNIGQEVSDDFFENAVLALYG